MLVPLQKFVYNSKSKLINDLFFKANELDSP